MISPQALMAAKQLQGVSQDQLLPAIGGILEKNPQVPLMQLVAAHKMLTQQQQQQQAMQAMQMAQQGGGVTPQQPTTVAQDTQQGLAQLATQRQQAPEEQGIGRLPVHQFNPEHYAHGGIVAFAGRDNDQVVEGDPETNRAHAVYGKALSESGIANALRAGAAGVKDFFGYIPRRLMGKTDEAELAPATAALARENEARVGANNARIADADARMPSRDDRGIASGMLPFDPMRGGVQMPTSGTARVPVPAAAENAPAAAAPAAAENAPAAAAPAAAETTTRPSATRRPAASPTAAADTTTSIDNRGQGLRANKLSTLDAIKKRSDNLDLDMESYIQKAMEEDTPEKRSTMMKTAREAYAERQKNMFKEQGIDPKMYKTELLNIAEQGKQAAKDKDFDTAMRFAEGFFHMAAGTSPYAMSNIASGLGVTVKGLRDSQKEFREAALARQKAALSIKLAERAAAEGDFDKQERYAQEYVRQSEASTDRKLKAVSTLYQGRLTAEQTQAYREGTLANAQAKLAEVQAYHGATAANQRFALDERKHSNLINQLATEERIVQTGLKDFEAANASIHGKIQRVQARAASGNLSDEDKAYLNSGPVKDYLAQQRKFQARLNQIEQDRYSAYGGARSSSASGFNPGDIDAELAKRQARR